MDHAELEHELLVMEATVKDLQDEVTRRSRDILASITRLRGELGEARNKRTLIIEVTGPVTERIDT